MTRALAGLVAGSVGANDTRAHGDRPRAPALRGLAVPARTRLGVLDANGPRLGCRSPQGSRDRDRPYRRRVHRARRCGARVPALGGLWSAAVGAAVLVALLTFVAPVLLELVFDRFRPLDDKRLANELRALADRAGVPIRDVVDVGPTRTLPDHEENAYVSGLGRTRRVVLWDTPSSEAASPELKPSSRTSSASPVPACRPRHPPRDGGRGRLRACAVGSRRRSWRPRHRPVRLLPLHGARDRDAAFLRGAVPALRTRPQTVSRSTSPTTPRPTSGSTSSSRATISRISTRPARSTSRCTAIPTPAERIAAGRAWKRGAAVPVQ